MGELSAGAFIIGGFNALAFTGTSYLFRMMDKSGYLKETKRHNRAIEEMASAKEKWYENQVKNKDRIQKLRRDTAAAGADIASTNRALLSVQKIIHNGTTFTSVPTVANFYEPSDEMKSLEHVASSVAGLGLGAAAAVFLL